MPYNFDSRLLEHLRNQRLAQNSIQPSLNGSPRDTLLEILRQKTAQPDLSAIEQQESMPAQEQPMLPQEPAQNQAPTIDPALQEFLSTAKGPDQELLAAQEQAAQNRQEGGILSGLERLGRGVAGARSRLGAFKDLEGRAEQPVLDILQQRKEQREDEKSQMEKMKLLKTLKENKQIVSPAIRSLAEQAGIDIPEGATAEDAKSLLPWFSALQRAKDNELMTRKLNEYWTPRVGIMGKEHERKKEGQVWRMSEKQELSDRQTENIQTIDDALFHLNKIKELKKDIDTGPIAGRVAGVQQALGIDDPRVTAFKAKVGRELMNYIKRMSGVQFSDKERLFQKANMLNMNLSDEAFNAMTQDIIDDLKQTKTRYLENLRRSGKDPRAHIPENIGLQEGNLEPFDAPLPDKTGQAPQVTPLSGPSQEDISNYAKQYGLSEERAAAILRKRMGM